MDRKKLIALRRGSPIARLVFEQLATRQKNSAETTVENLEGLLRRDGHQVSRNDVVAFFKALEDAECGDFIVGRRGQHSRFRWGDRMLDVASTAQSEDEEEPDSEEPEAADNELPEMDTHHFILRRKPKLIVELEIPSDITDGEASRLSDWIKTLPDR